MASAIDQLPEVPAEPAFPAADAFPTASTVVVHQTLAYVPVFRGTGVAVTELVAEQALQANKAIPEELPRAVRLKIKSDGTGVRYAKRRNGSGDWELCFASLDPWLADIVEHQSADGGVSHWRVTLTNDVVVTWTGAWDDHPDLPGGWILNPWYRQTFSC